VRDCPHGQVSPLACLDCVEEGNVPDRRADLIEADRRERAEASGEILGDTVVITRPFKSKYTGVCQPCDGDIYVGDLIVKLSDGRYIHYQPCSEDLDYEER
jgi:hypothetical protein